MADGRRNNGRKSLLNTKLIKNAEELLKKGYYVVTVCDYLGIHESSWYNWYNKGEELSELPEEEQSQLSEFQRNQIKFFKTIKKATAKAEMIALDKIQSASYKSWQAAAWYLERKHNARWGRVTQDDSTNTNTNNLDKFLQGMNKLAEEDDDE